jgi:hypothetical protein
MVMVFSIKSRTALISCKVCLPMIRSLLGVLFFLSFKLFSLVVAS